MKTSALCLLLFTLTLHAQPASETDYVSRLTTDLLPLKSADADLNGVMQRYKADLMSYEQQRFFTAKPAEGPLRPFFSGDQAYELTAALAGKNLTATNVTPLAQAILGFIDSALACRNSRSSLRDSTTFRKSAEQALNALHSIGVESESERILMDIFFKQAIGVAEPPVHVDYK